MVGFNRNKDREVSFADLFEGHRFLTKRDMVRPHTRDEYGLGEGWVFCCGKYVNNVWTMVWVKLKPEFHGEAGNNATCGDYQSAMLKKRDDRVHCECGALCGIGSYYLCGNVTDIPEDVMRLVREN